MENAVWGRGWVAPYESTYNLLQKLAWANLTSPAQICGEIFGVGLRPMWTAHGHPRSLLSSQWMNAASGIASSQFPVIAGTLTHFAGAWAVYLGDDRHFRFCQGCLERGYHSVFFQVLGLLRCPIHAEPLLDDCRSCHAPTGPFALCSDSFDWPFHCASCLKPYATRFSPATFRADSHFRDVITSLCDLWLGGSDVCGISGLRQPLDLRHRRRVNWRVYANTRQKIRTAWCFAPRTH